MDQVHDQGANSIKKAYSKSALQILSAYHNWRQRGANALDAPEYPLESELLEKDSYEIWKLASEVSGDEYLGLHAGSVLARHMQGHFLTTLAANSTTVGDALENLCNYHAVCSDAPHPKFERRYSKAIISITDLEGDADEGVIRHMCDCLFSAIVTTLGMVCRQQVRPSAVHFAWPSPASTALHESLFNAPVYFASPKTALEFSADTLNITIPYADQLLLSTLTRYADGQLSAMYESDSWAKKVKSVLCHSGLSIDTGIGTVADNLCVSPRTLQQRLKSEGTNYQNIVREIKTEIAKDYLSNRSVPLAEIALVLGYSEQSAFNHAFKLWTGLTPRQFRQSFFEQKGP